MLWSAREPAARVVRGLTLGLLAAGAQLATQLGCQQATERPVAEQLPRPPQATACSCPTSFAELAAKADPAVVFIETEQPPTIDEGAHGLGSGFVIDPDGLVLTNHHVVRGATAVHVQLQERQLRAKVVGEDPLTDVAVLRVDATQLPSLPLGDSSSARVGDWVVAIGNPFGLSHTVSAGIISAQGRTRHDVDLDPAGYYSFLQTDASINPGNSGGPLLDISGKVVGMNTAIRAGANSIGFAIPIDMIKALLPSLLREGRLRRSHLGVVAETFEVEEARKLDLPGTPAIVKAVAPGSPGDQAGLRAGDLILEFDGAEVRGKEMLRWFASIAGVGQKVRLKIRRGPRELELDVVLGAMPEE